MKRWTWLAVPAILVAVLASPAYAGGRTTNSIWLLQQGGKVAASSPDTVHYGQTFEAGFQSKLASPAGYAQCWAGNATSGTPFWSAWGRVQADGALGVFELASVDPNQTWPAAGGWCNVSLVSLTGGKSTVLATSSYFAVTP